MRVFFEHKIWKHKIMMDEISVGSNIPTPAQKIRKIADTASAFTVDINQPARMYFRSGLEMVRMADMYLKQGSLKEAYLLYLKFMTLFLEKIRDHPGWSTLPLADRNFTSKKVKEILPKTERLKDQLLEQFKEEYVMALENEKRRIELDREAKKRLLEKERQQELMRISHESSHDIAEGPREYLSNVVTGPTQTLDSIVYPDADKRSSNSDLIKPASPWHKSEDNTHPYSPVDYHHPGSQTHRMPLVDRSTKPASLLSSSTQSRYGLRNVVVPSQLVERFLTLAHSTTVKNIETCGILAGQLDFNQLVITHLIVPKQHASPDSCTTENEEEVFNFQDKNDLITLGWIHTHPSQTAFLSSVDLHTHCSYQLMMSEAIAIVCAPRYQDNSIFCLTPDYGLEFIAKCRKTGFHPHPSEPPLFTIADHARLESQLPVEVVDLRRIN